ncbi:MAG TPA: biotin transporter BioY, partial [Ilumatobacteraceae bacterium]|nr:biotin transporter BioY [Ilumatobacteraceae bacterium]
MTTAMHPQAGHVPTRRLVLADLIPNMRLRSAALVVAGALLTAAASQVRIPLGFTPVPINLATFAAALTGGALGMRRGVASMTLYLLAGIVGLPFFAGGTSGWSIVSGATGGYLVCYPVMAAIVGWAAQRGHDRRVGSFVAAVVAANAVLYLVGALWLGHVV